jgi:hypothetical protein
MMHVLLYLMIENKFGFFLTLTYYITCIFSRIKNRIYFKKAKNNDENTTKFIFF